jgi:hypothetical protein
MQGSRTDVHIFGKNSSARLTTGQSLALRLFCYLFIVKECRAN